MLEVQQAAMGSEARSRLDTMRAELGLPDPTTGELGRARLAEWVRPERWGRGWPPTTPPPGGCAGG